MVWVIVVIIIVAFGVTMAITIPKAWANGKKAGNDMKDGNLIKRHMSFERDIQYLKANIRDPKAFYTALTKAVSAANVCKMSGNYNKKVYYNALSGKWTAELARVSDSGGCMVFTTRIIHSKRYDVLDDMQLQRDYNYLLTAIERTFLQFDINTTVRLEANNLKSSASLI